MTRKNVIRIVAWILFAIGAITLVFNHFIFRNPFVPLSFTTSGVSLIILTSISLAFIQSNEIKIAQWSLLVATVVLLLFVIAVDRELGIQYQGTASGIFVVSSMPFALWGPKHTKLAFSTFIVTLVGVFIIYYVAFPHIPIRDTPPSSPWEFFFRYGLAGVGVLFLHLGNITKRKSE